MGLRTSSCSRMQPGLAFVGARVCRTPTLGQDTSPKHSGPRHSQLLKSSGCRYEDSVWTRDSPTRFTGPEKPRSQMAQRAVCMGESQSRPAHSTHH